MVSTAHPAATEAGLAMLRAGGNAADAAAAAAFALAVVEQYSSGIGGGGFALVRSSRREGGHNPKDGGSDLVFLDFREVAPKAATSDMYMRDGKPDPIASRDGISSVAVPGAVAGYLQLQQTYGRLTRGQVLAPAIALAEGGFLITPRYQKSCQRRLELLRQDPEASRVLLIPDPEGGPPVIPPIGHRLIQADLAATLRALLEQGAQAFYKGPIAEKLVADMKARGGLITAEDLAGYRVRERAPLVGTYRGHAVVTSPPPSSGGQILLTILNVMETLPKDGPRAVAWRSPHWLHTYIEASKRAFADRHLLGDPDFVPGMEKLIPALVDKERAWKIAATIGPDAQRPWDIPPGQGATIPTGISVPEIPRPGPESEDTTHLSVIDAWGNAVAMTTTVNYSWGSGVMAKGTGMIWNDEMDDFAVAPGVPNVYGIVGSKANRVEPGKVPLSSMTPTFVFAGATTTSDLRLVIGSPGGSRIPTSVAQAIFAYLDYGADIEKAIDLGRIHHQHLPDSIYVEPFALEPVTRRALERRGHIFVSSERTWSNVTAVAVDPETGVRTGAADSRGLGTAAAQW